MASLGGSGSTAGWPPSTSTGTTPAASRPLGSRNPFRDDAAADVAHDNDNQDVGMTAVAQHTVQPLAVSEDPFAQATTSSSATPNLAQEQKGIGGGSKSEFRVDDLVGAMAETSLDGGAAASSSTSQPTTTASTSSQPQAQSRPPAVPSFSPTTTPTPGRPLLHNGQILVMPPTWDGCDACQGTGYICGDPSEPHDPCWEAYGRTWREGIEYSDEVVEGAMILQQGLPERPLGGSSSSASASGSGSAYRPPAGPPPAPQQQQQHPQSFIAPSHLPPPRHPSITASHRPRPRSPPRVNRAQDAGEAGDDALGEAPPAYEDVLRAPVGMALPPQTRTEAEQRHEQQQQQQQQASSAVHSPPPHAPPPLRPPIAGPGSVPGAYYGGGGYGAGPSSHWHPPPLSPPQHPPPQQGWSGYPGSPHHSGGGPSSPYHQPYPPHHQPPWGSHPHQYPHPHAHPHQPVRPLYVQPGDARIGGMLCWKCEGTGTKTSWFWGDEGNCSACGGLGRIR